jgi:hypothetical protein
LKPADPTVAGFRHFTTTITITIRSTTMAKQALDPRDAHTYRITLLYPHGVSGATSCDVKEVIAVYYQHDNGFIVFKDIEHAAVLTVASSSVLEIERLRTHSILAVADDELDMVVSALREQAGRVFRGADDSDTVHEAERLTALADSLERLVPVAADRAAKDASSMPRSTSTASAVFCTCGVMTGGARSDNPNCPMHHGSFQYTPAAA